MKATDLDYPAPCRACQDGLPDRYDTCPSCGDGRHSHDSNGNGTVNRLAVAPDGEVRLAEKVSPQGIVLLETIPIWDEETGGLEGRYGDWTPQDLDSGPMADYQPDTRDQLANRPLGANAPYEVYGTTVEEGDMAGGRWPSSPDLSAQQVAAWARARGDEYTASIMDQLAAEDGSPW